MLRTIYAAILVLATILGGCNKRSVTLSNQDAEKSQDEKSRGIDAEGVTSPEKVSAEAMAAPKRWPQCWLSYRLSVVASFYTAGSRGDSWVDPTYTEGDGRQEFQGKSYNPSVSGNCVLNWFAQDYSKEPWVALFKQKFPSYAAVVSCTATSTPDCLCAATLPVLRNDFHESRERCVRKTAAGDYELYSVREVADNQSVPAAGRCDAVLKTVGAIARTNLGLGSFLQETKDRLEVGSVGQACRTDFEPFAPLPEEKDWYANEIRDWGITTCTDQNTGCRCYAIYNKSGYRAGSRASVFEDETCLLCKDGTCQLVKM